MCVRLRGDRQWQQQQQQQASRGWSWSRGVREQGWYWGQETAAAVLVTRATSDISKYTFWFWEEILLSICWPDHQKLLWGRQFKKSAQSQEPKRMWWSSWSHGFVFSGLRYPWSTTRWIVSGKPQKQSENFKLQPILMNAMRLCTILLCAAQGVNTLHPLPAYVLLKGMNMLHPPPNC